MIENETQVEPTHGTWRADGEHVLDSKGFIIGTTDDTAVLRDWESAGALHWSDRPGVTFIERAPGEAEANARLMAAAPDLLAACREFVRKCDAGLAHSVRSYEQMRAAIAKAEGD